MKQPAWLADALAHAAAEVDAVRDLSLSTLGRLADAFGSIDVPAWAADSIVRALQHDDLIAQRLASLASRLTQLAEACQAAGPAAPVTSQPETSAPGDGTVELF